MFGGALGMSVQQIGLVLEIVAALLLATPLIDPQRIDALQKRVLQLQASLSSGTAWEARVMRRLSSPWGTPSAAPSGRVQQWALTISYVMGFSLCGLLAYRYDLVPILGMRDILTGVAIAGPILLIALGAAESRMREGPARIIVLGLLQLPFVLLLLPGLVFFWSFFVINLLVRGALATMLRPVAVSFGLMINARATRRLAAAGLLLMLTGLFLQFSAVDESVPRPSDALESAEKETTAPTVAPANEAEGTNVSANTTSLGAMEAGDGPG